MGWRSPKASEREDVLFKIHEGCKGLTSLRAGYGFGKNMILPAPVFFSCVTLSVGTINF